MQRFKSFLLEYLTDKQREKYSSVEMTDKARADTDHFFGKGTDIVHGEVEQQHSHDKSEIHKAVEKHLGRDVSHEDYAAGRTKDHLGRDTKIGKLIKDSSLRDQFASDTTREGSKLGTKFKTSTVRGVEVAGQTNSAPDPQHPKGHSWGKLSCKNVDSGINKHYLKDEIKHGTVVHRVHDHSGQEIYRATLQPHHNDQGHVAYAVDSEYGIKHPAFTASSHETAKKLSGEHKGGSIGYAKHPAVYNDNGYRDILHPNTKPEHISRALDDENSNVRRNAAGHPKATTEHISKALKDEDEYVRGAAAGHPNATPEHISKALGDESSYVRSAAIWNKNATSEHISRALDDENSNVRRNAADHPKATPEHISKALKDKDPGVRASAIEHPKATPEHISKALDDKDPDVRSAAAKRQSKL